MLRKKNNLLNTLNAHIEEIRSQQAITQEEKIKMEALKVYERELKATEKSLATVLQDLNQTLSSDYRSLDTLKHSFQMRVVRLQTWMQRTHFLLKVKNSIIVILNQNSYIFHITHPHLTTVFDGLK